MVKKTKTIYVVFKTHFDIGYTELAEEVIQRYGKSMLPDVVKTCENTRQNHEKLRYAWTMASWPLLQSLNPQNAELQMIDKAKDLIKEGQIIWHALPYTTHTEFCGLEEFIRGMYFSRQLSVEYGRWPKSAKMTDVPGHTWILPSLLYKAGIRFLHLGCNPGCMPPDVPRLFFWEGPDGNRVLTFYNKGCYGSSLIPPNDWTYPVWLALMQTNDNMGPQGPEIIDDIVKEINSQMPGTEVVIGSMDDFYSALEQYPLDNIPVIKADLADTWIHGVGTYPREVKKIREMRSELTQVERALSLGTILGIFSSEQEKYFRECLSNAFENSLLFGEHTWGLDVKLTMGINRHYKKAEFLKDKNSPVNQRMEQSWEEQRERVLTVEKILEATSPQMLDTIAAAVGGEGEHFIVFNGLGWKRDAWIRLDKHESELVGKQLFDADNKTLIPIEKWNNCLQAYIRNIPAFGYKNLLVIEKDDHANKAGINESILCDTVKGTIENRWFKVETNLKDGTVKSLLEKSVGKEWVHSQCQNGFAQYQYDVYGDGEVTEFIREYTFRFYDWLVNDLGRMEYPSCSHKTFLPDRFSAEMERGCECASLILKTVIEDDSVYEYGNTRQFKLRITLYENLPYIDLEFNLKGKEETPFIEAGHFVFPINLKEPKIRINKVGSVIDPSVDIVKDANHGLYCCENWVDLSDGKDGIAFVPFDTPLFSIGEQTIYKYIREYKATEPVLYFNAFNNSWGTNFPQWMGGDYSFRYRVIPHRGEWMEAGIPRIAEESLSHPQVGFFKGKKDGFRGLPERFELIKELEGLSILTLKKAEEGNGFILRVREMEGLKGVSRITFVKPVNNVYACNLLEIKNDRIRVISDSGCHSIQFETGPFEIHTFYFES